MIQFGFFAALLLLVALCLILIPLLLTQEVEFKGDDQVNIELAKKKIKEIEDDLAAGLIQQDVFDQATREIELSLYRDLDGKQSATVSAKNGRWLAIPLLFAVPLVSLALYTVLGDLRIFDQEAMRALIAPESPETGHANKSDQIKAMVDKLAAKMEKEPNDVEGWLMLSRSYKVLERFQDAANAMRKAYALTGDKPDVLLQLADALAMANGGTLKGEPTSLVEKALKVEPKNQMGLWLMGMAYAENDQYQQAADTWQALLKDYPPDQNGYDEVVKLINEANARLGKPAIQAAAPKAEPTPAAAAQASGRKVKVKVTLDDSFKDKIKPEDTLFIYAQAASGPKAPLAIVKHQARELPIEVTLDDSQAMMPAMTISTVDHIKITARVSAAGGAVPQSGEPYGAIEMKGDAGNEVKNIVINNMIN
jgi:cytochrome c-type biogenesis protein CcmH